MATVTMEQFGQQLETVLGQLGVITRLLKCKETPQQYCFDFAGGGYRTTTLKGAMDFLNNRNGLTYEKNIDGGFTVMKRKENRDFVSCGSAVKPLDELGVKDNAELNRKGYLSFGLGADGYVVRNMDDCVHLLIAGSAGSGKSVLMNSLIMQLLCYSNAQLLLIDPKNGAEFGIYEQDVHNRIDHIAKDTPDALKWLKIAVDVMERRYNDMGQRGLKKYDGNKFIVIIDELADLMMTSGKEVEEHIIRIAQKGRAAGVHLIVATQDPRASVITGLIKYNMPTKICLSTANARHSMNMIDCGKAAQLLGKGDAYIKLPDSVQLQRIQCPNISDDEIIEIITKRTV